MTILAADLDNDRYERVEMDSDLSGLELGAFLFSEFSKGDPIVIIPPPADCLRFSGSAVFSIIYKSPISGRMSLSYSSFAPGLSLRLFGYDAVVVSGKAGSLSMLSVGSDGAERSVAVQYSGLSALAFEEAARKNVGDVFLSVGRAAENGVLFSSLQSGGRELQGAGLGYVFASKRIKGISFPSFPRKDLLGSGHEERRCRMRMERGRMAKRIRKEGGGIFVDAALRLGCLPVQNYSLRYDPRAYFLDGKAYNEKYGVYRESCQDCFFACARRRQDNTLLPTWNEAASLGSCLGFFDPENVSRVSDAVREEGLSAVYAGAVLAAISADRALGVDECVSWVHRIGEGKAPFRTLDDIPGAVCMADGSALSLDLRGSFPHAIAAAFSIPLSLEASLLMPLRPLGVRSSAVMALYESVYSLSLISLGYPPMASISEWWGRFPSFLYSVPWAAYAIARLFRAFGRKGRNLQESGLRLLSLFSSGPHALPDAFTLNPDSAASDSRTVPYTQLVQAYEAERDRLEMTVRSRRESSERRSSSNKAAVGPSTERGREGDPGLTR